MNIQINGADTYLTAQGEGEAALLLHGVPDCANLWDKVIPLIGHRYRCFAADLPGIYRSATPKDYCFDLDSYADWVDALVDALVQTQQVELPLTLICHDWGAIYGMLWACKYPHKVKRVVAGDFPFSSQYRWHEWARIWQTPLLGEVSMLGMNWPLFRWELRRSARRMTPDDMRATYTAAPKSWSTRWTVLRMYRSAAPKKFAAWAERQQRLAQQVPIDIIWGADDVYVPIEEARRLCSRSLSIIDNCGHWPPLEAPQEYADRVLI